MVESLKTGLKLVFSNFTSYFGQKKSEKQELSKQRILSFDRQANQEDLEEPIGQGLLPLDNQDQSEVMSDEASVCDSDCSSCDMRRIKRKTEEFHGKLKKI